MPSPFRSLRRRHRAYKYGRDPEATRRPSLRRAGVVAQVLRPRHVSRHKAIRSQGALIRSTYSGDACVPFQGALRQCHPCRTDDKRNPSTQSTCRTLTSASLQTIPIRSEVFTDTTCDQDGQVVHDSSPFTVCGPCLRIHLRNKTNGSIRFGGDFLHDVFDVKLSHVSPYFRPFRNARPAAVTVIPERVPDG